MKRRLRAFGRAPGFALALALAALAGAPSAGRAAEGVEVDATLEPQSLGPDELATFTIEVRSGGFSGLAVVPRFDLEHFEIAGGPVQSQSHRWVNGASSSSVSLIWQLKPKGIGKARVRNIRVEVGGTTYPLPDQDADVVQGVSAPAGPHTGGSPAPAPFEDLFGGPSPFARRSARPPAKPRLFLRTEIEPDHIVVGQQAVWRLVLFTQTDVGSFEPEKLPDFRGFWVRDMQQPERLRPEWIEQNGERFGRVVMVQRAIYPLRDGSIEIEPIRVGIVARVVDPDPWSPFFGRNEALHLTTNPLTVEVQPIPGVPAGFTGPVGATGAEASLDRKEVEAGQAATLTVRITSRGNVESVPAPAPVFPAGLQLFPPRVTTEQKIVSGRLSLTKSWSFVIVPDRAGHFEVPRFEIAYFEPGAGPRQAATEPLSLEVRPAATAAAGATPTSPAAPAERPPEGAATTTAPWRDASALPWAIAVVALLAAGVAIAWARRSSGAMRSPIRAAFLARLATAPAAAKPRDAAEAIELAWRDFLAARFQMPPETPAAEWRDRLTGQGVAARTSDEIGALAEDLHYLRFAPELAAAGKLVNEVVERSSRLVRALG